LGKHEEAIEHIRGILDEYPKDPETWSLLGRVLKDRWIAAWRVPGKTPPQMRELAAVEDARLAEAIEPYVSAFIEDSRHFYSGINAITLRHLQRHLGGTTQCRASLGDLEGGVLWSCLTALEREPKDYWARASFAELNVLLSNTDRVVSEYRSAVAAANRDWFALDSTRQQLLLLRDLGFRPEQVAAALDVVEKEIATTTTPWKPGKVFLFSGHMIDRPSRPQPRFPAEKELIAAKAIADRLDAFEAGPGDLAICGGACGGDTLFAEACLARGLRLQLHIQFQEREFLRASVGFAGDTWLDRYDRLKANPNTSVLVQPDELGPAPRGTDPYVRNNLWQLYTALTHGAEKVRFISFWDGKEGDGPGGTRDMVRAVEQHAGRAYNLDPATLW
jgi:hypothetical protein